MIKKFIFYLLKQIYYCQKYKNLKFHAYHQKQSILIIKIKILFTKY